jgi:hypothetical protein
MILLLATLRALARPERLGPTLLVVVLLLVVQGRLSREPLAALVALAMCLFFWLIGPFAFRALLPAGASLARLAAGLVAYAAVGAGCVALTGRIFPRLLGLGPTFLTDDGSLVVAAALFWVGGWGLARDIDRAEALTRERQRARALEREASRAQLLAVQASLDPHFLFNTLGAIAEWCREDPLVAERALLELSTLLRTVLGGVREETWPLDRELDLVRRLCSLHAVRDPEAIRLDERVEGDPTAARVPPMLVLSLVENAIKHGPWAGHRGPIELRAAVGERSLRVEIENPGAFAGVRPGGLGLPQLRERLQVVYGALATFSIEARGARTVASIELPLYPPGP